MGYLFSIFVTINRLNMSAFNNFYAFLKEFLNVDDSASYKNMKKN